MSVILQTPNIIIPQAGFGFETIADAVARPSVAVLTENLQEKQASVIATMMAAPGPLNCWVEISATGAVGTWVVLGAVQTLVATGSLVLAWTVHSSYARVVVQAPLFVAGAWVAVVTAEGKTP